MAESPETPLTVLEQLAGDLELPLRLAVKFNPSCPPPLIELVEGQHTVASDWHTDVEQLAMLGQSRWAWIRLAVARNPNTPEDILLRLASDPILIIQLAAAKNPGTLEQLANHPDPSVQQAAVVAHPNLSDLMLQSWSNQKSLIMGQSQLPVSILSRIFDEAESDKPLWQNYQLRNQLLCHTNTPAWILARLAEHDLAEIRADKQNCLPHSPEILEKWVLEATDYLSEIAKHPNVSSETLVQLADHPNSKVRLAVARNLTTPEQLRRQLLSELITHPEPDIQVEIASDSNTPVKILTQLARASSLANWAMDSIRQMLPTSDYLVDAVTTFITSHESPELISFWLRQDAAFREPILQEWRQLLANLTESDRPNFEVLCRQMLPAIGLSGGLPSEDRWLSQYGYPSPEFDLYGLLLRFGLAGSSGNCRGRAVPVALVGNPHTPVDVRSQLWQLNKKAPDDFGRYLQDADFRMALALNPTVPEAERREYFQQLIATSDNVRENLARNLKTPPEILLQLMTKQGVGRQAVSRNPNAPASALAELAPDSNRTTRGWVAKNPSTPPNLLIQLATDSDEGVRDSALKNQNMPLLERYRLLIAQDEDRETVEAHELLALRPDSAYALAQVLEKGDQKARITAARSHQTPIHVLEQLAKDPDETVRQVVLQNSNLPLNSLLELAQDPSVNVRLSLAYKASYYRETPTPIQLLARLAQDESEQVRARVAEHPDTPIEILVRLANDSNREVKAKLIGNLNTPITVLTRLGLEENLVNRRNPNTPGIVLAQAVNSMSRKDLADFIKHPVKGSQMPAQTLTQLANSFDNSVRYRVASHPNTPTSTLEQLARDSYVPTLRAVVENSNTPPHLLEQLANTPDLTIRLGIARNQNTPARSLAQIVLSSHSANEPNRTVDTLKSAFPGNQNDVLSAIALNPRTPLDALEILARREFVGAKPDLKSFIPPRTDDNVVQKLAYNPSLTPELLGILTQDPCVDVRVCLVPHPNLTESLWMRLAEDEALSVREAVAANIKAPERVLELLAKDELGEVRVKVATNPNTPTAVLEVLALDENSAVRAATASNPNLTPATSAQLANDQKVEVRRAVAQNPHTPASIRETLRELVLQPTTRQTSPTLRSLSRIYNPQTDDLATVLTEYAQSDNAFVRLVTLLHPLTPKEVLEQGMRSQSWIERYAVADNPATPTELRQQLAQDSNRVVRATANNSL